MGSFANSFHVRSEDAAAVAAAIRDTLHAEGYEPTDEEPNESTLFGSSSTLRAIQLSQACDGWVSVLDSDLTQSLALAADVSARLETHALQVLVNDSDSWHYQLFHAGRQLDAFDSSGEGDLAGGDEDDEDDGLADLAGLLPGSELADLQKTIFERARQLQDQIQAMLPPEMRAIQERWQAGRATPEDMHKYNQWMSTEMPRLMGGIKGLFGDLAPQAALHAGWARDEDELRPHVERLRPLLKAGITEERILGALGGRAVFAEETLGAFLPLLGIAPLYAHLSYRYVNETSAEELARASIRLAEHLTFRKSGRGPGRLRLFR